uniref:Uncharacterized protein n=1 Tax=Octopus bimaculoides TaxID=37653 RepID=A0A0L8GFD6_OCTBM
MVWFSNNHSNCLASPKGINTNCSKVEINKVQIIARNWEYNKIRNFILIKIKSV